MNLPSWPRYAATFALVALFLPVVASAQSYLLDVNGAPPDVNSMANPVVVPAIPAGTYDIVFVGTASGGQFDAVNYWGSVVGCDANGANCTQGWLHRVTCSIPGSGDIQFNELPMLWETPELAITNAPTGLSFDAPISGDLACWIFDNQYSDNLGGVSFEVIRRPESAAEIPALDGLGLLLLAVGLAAAVVHTLRRRSAA